MTDYELALIAWYRNLPNVERLAINAWLRTGDIRLMFHLWERLLGEYAQRLLQIAAPESSEQPLLVRR